MSTKDLDSFNTLSKSDLRKDIMKFSGPIVAELLLMSLLTIVNLSMVGHLGSYALSSVGLTSQPVTISLAVFQSLNTGATALIARFTGAKNEADTKKVLIQTMLQSVILGLLLSVVCYIFAREIVLAMGAKPETYEYATLYMRYMAAGMILQSIPTAVASLLRGIGESKAPMQFNMISNIVNALLGFVLINGLFFIPAMGLEGAAIASTIAKLTACVMSVIALLKSSLPLPRTWQEAVGFDFPTFRRIWRIGLSSAAENLSMRVGFLMFSRIIADLGTVPLAAHQIILSITSLVSNIIMAFSIATSSFTGRYLGAGKPDLAEETNTEICKMGLYLSLAIGAVFFFFGYPISAFFSSEIPVRQLTGSVLKIAALITLPQNSLMILSGSLRGAGDTRWPMLSSILGTVVARVAVAFLLVRVFHMGLMGAWLAALADQSTRSLLINLRYKTGRWKKITV